MFSFFLEESPKLYKIQWIESLCFSPSLKQTENRKLKPINSVNYRLYFRGRLNPHRLPWCGKPRTFGDHVCHMILRYSCQHYHFWYLQLLWQLTFKKLQNVLLPFYHIPDKSRRFGVYFEPRYIFGAIKLDQWAITLSSKDGCFQAHLLVVKALVHPFPLK